MLRAVASVRDEVVARCGVDAIDLETITWAFERLTIIDKIVFVRYDTPPENPIIGEFVRWNQSPAVYAPLQTLAEVRYASHLGEDWRRFVVCKELCHALEERDGSHVISPSRIDRLVEAFSLRSAAKLDPQDAAPIHNETLAEAGALELLCPLDCRKAVLAMGNPSETTKEKLAADFNFPLVYAELALDLSYNQGIEFLLEIQI